MGWETYRLCTGREFERERRWLSCADSVGRLDPVRWQEQKLQKDRPPKTFDERCFMRVETALSTMPMPTCWVMQRSERRRKDAENAKRDALRALARLLASRRPINPWPMHGNWPQVLSRLNGDPKKWRDALYRAIEEGGPI